LIRERNRGDPAGVIQIEGFLQGFVRVAEVPRCL
jgi:hypothetical protein